MIEREIKLRFESPDAARAAIAAAGLTPLHCRRLQDDCLLDTRDEQLRRQRAALRVRIESGRSLLTFKGPVQPAALMKTREELETIVADGPLLIRILGELGFFVWFRYEKYREEFGHQDVTVAIDETPAGTFVEVEGSEAGIQATAQALGRRPEEYIVDSYFRVWAQHCESRGVPVGHMLFDAE